MGTSYIRLYPLMEGNHEQTSACHGYPPLTPCPVAAQQLILQQTSAAEFLHGNQVVGDAWHCTTGAGPTVYVPA